MAEQNRLPDIKEHLMEVLREIKEPLDGVAGNAELILRENTNSKIKNSAYDISIATRSLGRYREDLLDLLGVLFGEIELEESEYETEEAVLFLRSRVEERTARKGISMSISIDKRLPVRVYGDVERLTGIICRLVLCAIEGAGAGGLQFSIQNIAEKGDLIYLKFNLSYSGSSELNTEYKSTLLIAQKLATQMGGKLTAEFGGSNKNKISIIVAQRRCGEAYLGDRVHDVEYIAANENAENDAAQIVRSCGPEQLRLFLEEAPTKADLTIHYLRIRDYRNCVRTLKSLLGQTELMGATAVIERVNELISEAKYGSYNQTLVNMQEFSNYIQRLCTAIRKASEEASADMGHAIIDNGNLLNIVDELERNLTEYKMERVEELYFNLSQLNSGNAELTELLIQGEEQLMNLELPDLRATLNEIKGRLSRPEPI